MSRQMVTILLVFLQEQSRCRQATMQKLLRLEQLGTGAMEALEKLIGQARKET